MATRAKVLERATSQEATFIVVVSAPLVPGARIVTSGSFISKRGELRSVSANPQLRSLTSKRRSRRARGRFQRFVRYGALRGKRVTSRSVRAWFKRSSHARASANGRV